MPRRPYVEAIKLGDVMLSRNPKFGDEIAHERPSFG